MAFRLLKTVAITISGMFIAIWQYQPAVGRDSPSAGELYIL
jgi:hypothetical protein